MPFLGKKLPCPFPVLDLTLVKPILSFSILPITVFAHYYFEHHLYELCSRKKRHGKRMIIPQTVIHTLVNIMNEISHISYIFSIGEFFFCILQFKKPWTSHTISWHNVLQHLLHERKLYALECKKCLSTLCQVVFSYIFCNDITHLL